MGLKTVVFFVLIGICYNSVQCSCTLNGYFEIGIMERFVQSNYIVYGRTVNHQAHKFGIKDEAIYVIDAVFQVYCVLKHGEENVAELITIKGITPRDECSGTPVHTLLRVGDHAILALEDSSDGTFIMHEITPKISAGVRALKPYFFSLSKICEMQDWEPAYGSSDNKCPICGISDFEAEVHALDNSAGLVTNCITTQNAVVINMTACDLYMEYSIGDANSQTCVPSDFSETCLELLYRTPTATCECRRELKDTKVGVSAGETLMSGVVVIVVGIPALCLALNF